MVRLGQAIFDPRFLTDQIKHILRRATLLRFELLCKRDASVCKNGVELVGHNFTQMLRSSMLS